jgi:hypothetical protein
MFSVKQHTPRSLAWWHQQHLTDKLDMDPPYQRRADIWTRWKRAHLIDSIINDYDIPKFYVGDFVRSRSAINEKNRPYAVIDGKQRFAAIFSFLDNELPLNPSSKLEADGSIKIGGLLFNDLKLHYPALATKVSQFEPVVMSVITDDREKIPQLFVRLNSGESVNRAEKRNAMPGIVPRMIADLTVHPFFQERIRFNIKRMQDANLVAKLLLIEYSGGFVDTKAKNLDDFVELGIEPSREIKDHLLRVEEKLQDVLEKLAAVFEDRDPLLSAQGGIPIYYWAIRNHPGTRRKFREFVSLFTQEVKENLPLLRKNPSKADPELSSYYTMARTTNDQASLEGRYKIFTKRLLAHSR